MLAWEIRSLEVLGDSGFFEWSFACAWLGERYDVEGASIVRFKESLISYLCEYATTAPLCDWEGAWR